MRATEPGAVVGGEGFPLPRVDVLPFRLFIVVREIEDFPHKEFGVALVAAPKL
jgi:hypothetical protein